MNVKEKEVIERAKNGDQKAFSEIYNKYYRLIRYIVYDSIKDETITAELVAIIFEKAFTKISYFVESISFEAWLKTIAVNTIIDYIRNLKIRPIVNSIDDEDSYIQVSSNVASPEEDLILRENIKILNEAMKRLRKTYSNLIRLKYYENRSYQEICSLLNLPMGTVKSYLNKAKKRLKQIFTELSQKN